KEFKTIKSAIKKPFKKMLVQNPFSRDLKSHSCEIMIPGLPAGFYTIVVANEEKIMEKGNTVLSLNRFQASPYTIQRTEDERRLVDAQTGIGLKDIPFSVYETKKHKLLYTLKTQTEGYMKSDDIVNYNDYNRRGYNLIFGDHAYHYYWYTYSYSHWHQKKNQVEIITDR